MKIRPDLAAFLVAVVIVVATVVLLLAGLAVPSWFAWLAVAAVTGGAGLALPGTPTSGATGLLAAGLAELRQYLDSHVHAAPPATPTAKPPTTSPPLSPPAP